MSDAGNRPGEPARQGGLGDGLAAEMAAVVREELRPVRAQFAEAVRPAAAGVVLLATAGGLMVLGVGAATTTVLRLLEAFLPKRLAAAGLTAGYFVAAGLLGRLGLERLQAAGGGSERLAGEVRRAVSDTMGRAVPSGISAAARDVAGR